MIETAGKTWAERAAIIPGGSLTRSKKVFGRWAHQGSGAILVDQDGHALIDMLCGLGAVSLGYHQQSYERHIRDGVFSLPHCAEVEAAEAVLEHVAPWASSVRFVKTGSEATHAAYRIAKAATGRRRVLMGDWAFHGWHEWCADPSFVYTSRYQHGAQLDTLNQFEDIAAVFIEPHRWEPVNAGWLKCVRDVCDKTGALLVFDSMIYGGRWALGGASEYFGVIPDLECFGKALGNGQSVAFVVGNGALRDHGETVSGTFSGEVSGLSAVLEVIRAYRLEGVIGRLWRRGRLLQRGIDSVLRQYPELQAVREGQPVHQRMRFVDPEHGKTFSGLMLERGILWHPDCVNIMAAHTSEQIEHVIEMADDCLLVMSKGL